MKKEKVGDGVEVDPWSAPYHGLSLCLRVCPKCGRHGEVLVLRQDTVLESIRVWRREDAFDIHQQFTRGGGQEQPEFLTAVRSADYLQDEAGLSSVFAGNGSAGMVAFGAVMVVFGDAGVVIGRVSRNARQTHRQGDDPLAEVDLSQASLTLEQCSCRAHAVMVLKLPTGETYDVAFPTTKEEACHELDGLLLRYRTLPDEQETFLEAVRTADYLDGPMPFQLV